MQLQWLLRSRSAHPSRLGSCRESHCGEQQPTAGCGNNNDGSLIPDNGEVRLGTNLAQVILDQRRETLDPEQSLTEALTGGSGDTVTVGGQRRHVIDTSRGSSFR